MDEQTQTPRSRKSPKSQVKHTPPEKLDGGEAKEGISKDTPPAARQRSPSPPPTHEGSYTDHFDSTSHTDNVPSIKEDNQPKEGTLYHESIIQETTCDEEYGAMNVNVKK